MKSADWDAYQIANWVGRYVNKNVYSKSGALIKPAHTVITEHDLDQLRSHRVSLTESDVESADEAAIGLVDDIYPELLDVFEAARTNGRIQMEAIEKQIVPIIRTHLSESSNLTRLILSLQAKDNITCRHSIAVAVISAQLGKWLKLSDLQLNTLTKAALLHDVGKLQVSDDILQKPGSLTYTEYEEMKRHTILGYELLLRSGVPEAYAKPALQHHERLDGSGYPYSISSEKIDYTSRVVAVADVFHAMCSKRTYKEKMPFHEVIRVIHRSAFGLFDAEIVSVFTQRMMEILIGEEVTLTNGQQGKVVSINPVDLWNPIVRIGGRFLNLSEYPDINIQEI